MKNPGFTGVLRCFRVPMQSLETSRKSLSCSDVEPKLLDASYANTGYLIFHIHFIPGFIPGFDFSYGLPPCRQRRLPSAINLTRSTHSPNRSFSVEKSVLINPRLRTCIGDGLPYCFLISSMTPK